jgi:hypothetical protein
MLSPFSFQLLTLLAYMILQTHSACSNPTPYSYNSACFRECPWNTTVVTYLDGTTCKTCTLSIYSACPSGLYADDSTKKCVLSTDNNTQPVPQPQSRPTRTPSTTDVSRNVPHRLRILLTRSPTLASNIVPRLTGPTKTMNLALLNVLLTHFSRSTAAKGLALNYATPNTMLTSTGRVSRQLIAPALLSPISVMTVLESASRVFISLISMSGCSRHIR